MVFPILECTRSQSTIAAPGAARSPRDVQHAERIGAVDLFDFDVLPDVEQLLHALAEIVGAAGQRGGVDGAGRSAADDVEGIARRRPARFPQYLRNRLQHADLVSGSGAAARQD